MAAEYGYQYPKSDIDACLGLGRSFSRVSNCSGPYEKFSGVIGVLVFVIFEVTQSKDSVLTHNECSVWPFAL